MDPYSIMAGAAIGGAAGKFTEQAWAQGSKWIAGYFKDHSPKAVEKAQSNSLDFLTELATRVKNLEDQGKHRKKQIDEALDQPDFTALLQKAMISSAQTSDHQKHELLARLVSERMSNGEGSLLALTCQMACEALPRMSITQLKTLAALATIFNIRPTPFPSENVVRQDQIMSLWWSGWLIKRLSYCHGLNVQSMDFLHLESLSCVRWDTFLSRDLKALLEFPKDSGLKFDFTSLAETELGKEFVTLWNTSLQHAMATTVGMLIGACVSDSYCSETTSLEKWGAT